MRRGLGGEGFDGAREEVESLYIGRIGSNGVEHVALW